MKKLTLARVVPDHFSQYFLAYLGITVSGSPFSPI
jgi:hypothetical protein